MTQRRREPRGWRAAGLRGGRRHLRHSGPRGRVPGARRPHPKPLSQQRRPSFPAEEGRSRQKEGRCRRMAGPEGDGVRGGGGGGAKRRREAGKLRERPPVRQRWALAGHRSSRGDTPHPCARPATETPNSDCLSAKVLRAVLAEKKKTATTRQPLSSAGGLMTFPRLKRAPPRGIQIFFCGKNVRGARTPFC